MDTGHAIETLIWEGPGLPVVPYERTDVAVGENQEGTAVMFAQMIFGSECLEKILKVNSLDVLHLLDPSVLESEAKGQAASTSQIEATTFTFLIFRQSKHANTLIRMQPPGNSDGNGVSVKPRVLPWNDF
jgi:hypothetical protein